MRVGDLPVGARFLTRLTKREGRVLHHYFKGATTVKWEDGEPDKELHNDVEVDIGE